MLAGLRAKLSTSSTDSAPQDKLRHTDSIAPESNGDIKALHCRFLNCKSPVQEPWGAGRPASEAVHLKHRLCPKRQAATF